MSASDEPRQKNQKGKKMHTKANDRDVHHHPYGVNTFGQPILPHTVVIQKTYDRYMKVMNNVKKYLNTDKISNQAANWKEKHFAFLYIKPYCRVADKKAKQLVPAEFSVTVFSFEGGALEMHAGFIDPGEIPFGEKGETRLNCEINGFAYPSEETKEVVSKLSPVVTARKFMRMIKELCNKYGLYNPKNDLLFFCTRFDIPIVRYCVDWILANSGNKYQIDLISFEILVKEMSWLVDDPENTVGVCNHEGGAGRFILSTRYDFHRNLACKWHRHGDAVTKIDNCALNIGLRRVYSTLFYLCHLFGREVTPRTHMPIMNTVTTPKT